VLRRQAARKKIREDVVVDLESRCFARACFAIPEVANVPVEDHEEVLAALKSVAEALLGDSAGGFDRDLFVENVRSAYAESNSPYLRGAMCGLLTETRAQPAELLSQEIVKFAQSRPEVMLTCGEFLDGVMATSRTAIMLGAQSLVEAFDVLLRAASWDQFLTCCRAPARPSSACTTARASPSPTASPSCTGCRRARATSWPSSTPRWARPRGWPASTRASPRS
jgi:hypothetical protein